MGEEGRKYMKDYKELSRKEFNRQASFYDESEAMSISKYPKECYPFILDMLKNRKYLSVLDMGCGTGAILEKISKENPKAFLFGLDLSENMIAEAKKKNIPKAQYVIGDAENLPYENEKFDVVICNQSFHHYPNPQAFFDSVKRCLKPGGRLILRDVTSNSKLVCWFMDKIEMPIVNLLGHGDVRVPTKEVIVKCCKNAGLTVDKFEIRKGMRLHCVVRKLK